MLMQEREINRKSQDSCDQNDGFLRRTTVWIKFFRKLEKQCPGAHELLMPHFDEIKDAVEAGRRAFAKLGKLR